MAHIASPTRRHFLVVSFGLLLGAAARVRPAFAGAGGITFVGEKFGTTVDLPAGLTMGPEPDAHDGRAFTSADGVRIAVFAHFNVLDDTLDTIVGGLRADGAHSGAVREARGADSVLVAGMRVVEGRQVAWVERYLLSADKGVVHGVEITYPAALAPVWAGEAERIAASLRIDSAAR